LPGHVKPKLKYRSVNRTGLSVFLRRFSQLGSPAAFALAESIFGSESPI
jgi:hypothetical protein